MSVSSHPYCKPEAYPWVMPCLVVPDISRSIAFYQQAFGFEFKDKSIDAKSGDCYCAELTYRDHIIFLTLEDFDDREQQAPVSNHVLSSMWLYLYCDDVDALYAQALAAGASSHRSPRHMSWGERMCTLIGINGYRWSFATVNS
ncbi:MAG: VOC family protein [Pseudomonadota bacterium]